MRKGEISKLQLQLFKYLEGYYKNYAFTFNKEECSFELDNVKIIMNVETELGPYYTIKPFISIIYMDILKEINFIISQYTKTNIPDIFFNSYFYLDYNLANNLVGYNKDDFHKNNYYENTKYEYRISTPVNVLESYSMHKKYMENIGFKAVQIFNNEEQYYDFMKKIYLNLFSDYENYPNKKLTDRPSILKANDIYTLAYISKRKDTKFINNFVKRYESILGEHHYNPIEMTKFIINF